MWSKVKGTQNAEETQSERQDKAEGLDNVHDRDSDSDEVQYPGLKVVLPSVLSVCLAVFLTALVSLLNRIRKIHDRQQ